MDETWIESNWWTLVLIGLGIVILILILIFSVYLSRRHKVKVPVNTFDYESELVSALGGEDNIVAVTIEGHKIIVELARFDEFDKTILSKLGINKTVLNAHLLSFSVKDPKQMEKLLSSHIKGKRNY